MIVMTAFRCHRVSVTPPLFAATLSDFRVLRRDLCCRFLSEALGRTIGDCGAVMPLAESACHTLQPCQFEV